jgi:hypothetical protein
MKLQLFPFDVLVDEGMHTVTQKHRGMFIQGLEAGMNGDSVRADSVR